MPLEQFERIMERYFDVSCEVAHEYKVDPAAIERAKQRWLYLKPTTPFSTSTVTFSGPYFGAPRSKREVRVISDCGAVDLSPRCIKGILASFGVPETDFSEVCNSEQQCDS